jgi:hypothetical protein
VQSATALVSVCICTPEITNTPLGIVCCLRGLHPKPQPLISDYYKKLIKYILHFSTSADILLVR